MDLDATQAIEWDGCEDTDDTAELDRTRTKKLIGHLKVFQHHQTEEKIFEIYEGDNFIGRSDCEITIPQKSLSKKHACIEAHEDLLLVYDNGSKNKTRKDKLILRPQVRYQLNDSDMLTFADVTCQYLHGVLQVDDNDDTGSETGSESMLPTDSEQQRAGDDNGRDSRDEDMTYAADTEPDTDDEGQKGEKAELNCRKVSDKDNQPARPVIPAVLYDSDQELPTPSRRNQTTVLESASDSEEPAGHSLDKHSSVPAAPERTIIEATPDRPEATPLTLIYSPDTPTSHHKLQGVTQTPSCPPTLVYDKNSPRKSIGEIMPSCPATLVYEKSSQQKGSEETPSYAPTQMYSSEHTTGSLQSTQPTAEPPIDKTPSKTPSKVKPHGVGDHVVYAPNTQGFSPGEEEELGLEATLAYAPKSPVDNPSVMQLPESGDEGKVGIDASDNSATQEYRLDETNEEEDEDLALLPTQAYLAKDVQDSESDENLFATEAARDMPFVTSKKPPPRETNNNKAAKDNEDDDVTDDDDSDDANDIGVQPTVPYNISNMAIHAYEAVIGRSGDDGDDDGATDDDDADNIGVQPTVPYDIRKTKKNPTNEDIKKQTGLSATTATVPYGGEAATQAYGNADDDDEKNTNQAETSIQVQATVPYGIEMETQTYDPATGHNDDDMTDDENNKNFAVAATVPYDLETQAYGVADDDDDKSDDENDKITKPNNPLLKREQSAMPSTLPYDIEMATQAYSAGDANDDDDTDSEMDTNAKRTKTSQPKDGENTQKGENISPTLPYCLDTQDYGDNNSDTNDELQEVKRLSSEEHEDNIAASILPETQAYGVDVSPAADDADGEDDPSGDGNESNDISESDGLGDTQPYGADEDIIPPSTTKETTEAEELDFPVATRLTFGETDDSEEDFRKPQGRQKKANTITTVPRRTPARKNKGRPAKRLDDEEEEQSTAMAKRAKHFDVDVEESPASSTTETSNRGKPAQHQDNEEDEPENKVKRNKGKPARLQDHEEDEEPVASTSATGITKTPGKGPNPKSARSTRSSRKKKNEKEEEDDDLSVPSGECEDEKGKMNSMMANKSTARRRAKRDHSEKDIVEQHDNDSVTGDLETTKRIVRARMTPATTTRNKRSACLQDDYKEEAVMGQDCGRKSSARGGRGRASKGKDNSEATNFVQKDVTNKDNVETEKTTFLTGNENGPQSSGRSGRAFKEKNNKEVKATTVEQQEEKKLPSRGSGRGKATRGKNNEATTAENVEEMTKEEPVEEGTTSLTEDDTGKKSTRRRGRGKGASGRHNKEVTTTHQEEQINEEESDEEEVASPVKRKGRGKARKSPQKITSHGTSSTPAPNSTPAKRTRGRGVKVKDEPETPVISSSSATSQTEMSLPDVTPLMPIFGRRGRGRVTLSSEGPELPEPFDDTPTPSRPEPGPLSVVKAISRRGKRGGRVVKTKDELLPDSSETLDLNEDTRSETPSEATSEAASETHSEPPQVFTTAYTRKGRGRAGKDSQASTDSTLSTGGGKGRAKKPKENRRSPSSSQTADSTLVDSPSAQAERPKGGVVLKRDSQESQEVQATPAKKGRRHEDGAAEAPSPSLRERKPEGKPRVMFTGLVDKQGEKVVTSLGGSLVNSVYECTHLVTEKVRRTVKFLCGLASGQLLVQPAWLEACKLAKTFVDPSPFFVHDRAAEKQYNFKLHESHQRALEGGLLQGYRVHVTKGVKPEPSQMKDIIKCAKGEVLPRMPRAKDDGILVISCEEDHQACKPAVNAGVPVYSAELLLTGILRHQLSLDENRLFSDGSAEESPSNQTRKRKNDTHSGDAPPKTARASRRKKK
ncbi:mediator of DNA damage checkpoint protein 1 isoform X2 [Nematostella vectensis]|uniref:mediator of DNA damage checkpoint protein 1 isoform X2 n=1 Tax=Nematostella vectensis TaxID=45351 RepID=UPI0020779A06|nr:mediator of DNA damage checkpoint protein 1 isoform X2 [Nematostella vectensis]